MIHVNLVTESYNSSVFMYKFNNTLHVGFTSEIFPFLEYMRNTCRLDA